MSTTTDKAVALKYGEDTWSGHGLSHVLELQMDSLNRGALLQAREEDAASAQNLGAVLIVSSCIPTGVRGPVCIVWAGLTPFSPT